MDIRDEELSKAKQEADYWRRKNAGAGALGVEAAQPQNQCATDKHPREVLLEELNDQEQRILDKLHAIREIKLEICALPRDEARRLMKISRLTQQLQ